MRVIVTAALSALMLSGCAINWPTKTSGPRFSWSSDTSAEPAPAKNERALRGH
jgi:hypothetical protein